jgi:hypothetical protein
MSFTKYVEGVCDATIPMVAVSCWIKAKYTKEKKKEKGKKEKKEKSTRTTTHQTWSLHVGSERDREDDKAVLMQRTRQILGHPRHRL